MGRRSESKSPDPNPRPILPPSKLAFFGEPSRSSRSPGLFHWRWRLGRFENAAQVANALHVLKGASVTGSWALVEEIQRQHDGKDTDPGLIWREAKKRVKEQGR